MVTYELRKKKGLKSSVYAIALVENPAIEVGFVALSKDGKKMTHQVKLSADKNMLYSPLVIPNQKIYREDENGQGYYIYFSEETCKEILHDFMAAQLNNQFNLEHDENMPIKNLSVVHSWIVTNAENGEAAKLGFDVPVGTPMIGISIKNNPEVKKLVAEGKVKGISLEGLFDNYTAYFNQSNYINMDKKETAVSQILTKLGELLSPTKLASAELANGGMIYTEGEFADGVNVYQDEAMQVLAEDGEYELADGRVLSVVEGKAASLREAVEEDMSENLSQEELAKHMLTMAENFDAFKKDVEAKFAELSKAHEELSANYNKVTEENKEVKAELAKVKETPAVKSATKLSEVALSGEGRFNSALRGERMNLKNKS